mmetsp:Transcript_72094/g.168903  ORF Transcript_72094/g.168903 Transcript_72094/m.168903 type:complete len:329 (-) Transcript_72094:83-1069(-)
MDAAQPLSASEDAAPHSARGLLEASDIDNETPMKGTSEISEEEFQRLKEFIYAMIGCLRQCELIFFVGLPLLGLAGAFFTTKEQGFPMMFYLGYVPFLLVNKGIEIYYLFRWKALDPVAAEIQKEQLAGCSLKHPVMLIYYGVMEHLDLFTDVVFTATAYAAGYKTLAAVSAVSLITAVVVQLTCSGASGLAMVVKGRNVYIPLVQVWMACELQGMAWLAQTTYVARFGKGDKVFDMGLASNRHFATIICEQLPQMILQSIYFRLTLEDLTLQARVQQWASVAISIGVMLNNARQEGCLFFTPCLLVAIAVIVLIFPAELVDSEIVWV